MNADFTEVERFGLTFCAHGDADIIPKQNGDFVAVEDFEKARQKIKEMCCLLLECRDALPAISLSSARLHNVDLNLANRIENCLSPWETK